MQSSPSQAGDFSWGDFASKGFSDEFDSDSFSLFSEVGRPSIDEEASLARSPQKLKKPYPYASLASRHMQFERRYYAERDEQANTPVVAAVKEIKIVQIDPIFAEVYLDSLENPAITSKWPVFALAELKGTKLPYKAIVVEVENVRPITQAVLPSCSTVSVPLSPSMGAKTAAKQRRGLFSIGGRKKRMSIHDSGREAQDSSDRAEKARFDEFGKRIAVKSESFNSQQQAQAHGSRSPRPFSLVKGIRESKSASPAADRESKVMPTTEAKTPVRSSPKPDTIAEVNETIEERSTPSPSISKSSSGRKLSRKPVPLVPGDEEAALDEVAEATNALDQASPAKGQAEMVSHAHAETSLDEVQIQHLEDASPQVPLEDSAFLAETADQATTIKTGEKGDDDNLESLKVGCLPIVIIPDAYNDGTELKPQNSKSDLRKEATVHAIPDEVVTQGDARAISTGVPEQPDLDEAPVKCEPSEGDSETLPAVAKGAVTIEEVEEVPGTSLPAQSPDVAEEPPDSDVVSKVDQEESEAKVERATEQLTHFRKADAVVDAEPEEENDAKSSTTEPPESTPKRFGSTLNRVSPSLKERFGSSSKPSSAQGEDKVMPKSSKTHPPPSPSRRAALLSGAKKMLTRRKSTPSDLDSITASKSIEHPSVPPIAMVPVVPKNSSAAEAQRGVEEPVKVSQTSAAEVVETTELPESEAERTILPPENNVSELVEKPLPSSQTAKSEEMSCTRPSAAQADAPRIAIDEHGLSEVTAQAVPQSVGDQECMQPTGIDSQVFREEHENLSTETASVEVEEESLEDGVPTLVHNPAESTKGLEPKHDSEARKFF